VGGSGADDESTVGGMPWTARRVFIRGQAFLVCSLYACCL
jgi:hypothetical protein